MFRAPEVCRIMTFWALFSLFWAILLNTFGIQVAMTVAMAAADVAASVEAALLVVVTRSRRNWKTQGEGMQAHIFSFLQFGYSQRYRIGHEHV